MNIYTPLLMLLAERDITKAQLSTGANLAKATMAKIEKGESITIDTLQRISRYLNVNVSELISFDLPSIETLRPSKEFLLSTGSQAFEFWTQFIESIVRICGGPAVDVGALLSNKRQASSTESRMVINLFSTIREKVTENMDPMSPKFVNELYEFLYNSDELGHFYFPNRRAISMAFSRHQPTEDLKSENVAALMEEVYPILVGTEEVKLVVMLLITAKFCLLSRSPIPLFNEATEDLLKGGLTDENPQTVYLVTAIDAALENTREFFGSRHIVIN